MARAECITTAVRELLSRGRQAKSTSPVRLAHIEFVAALAGNVPHPIYADIDSEDLDGRADHLEKVFAALFRNTRSAFLDHDRAKSELKNLIPEDACRSTS